MDPSEPFDPLAELVAEMPDWNEWRELMGLPPLPERRQPWTRHRLVEKAREAAARQDEPLTLYQFCRFAECSPVAVYRHFPHAGWPELRQEANLEPAPLGGKTTWSRERLVARLREFAAGREEPPRITDFCAEIGISSHTLYRHFPGRWEEALAAAGLEPGPRSQPRLSDDDLLAEWDRLHRHLDRPPTWSEVARFAKYGQSTYQNRLGNKPEILRRHAEWRGR